MSGFTTAVPVLPVSDLVRAMAWYERLGFEVRATFDGYAIVAFDDAEVHLNELADAPPATATYSGAYLRVANADVVHAHWSAMGARIIVGPEDQPYGIREFATEDLDGNLWRVGAPIGGIALPEPEPEPVSIPIAPVHDPYAEILAEHAFDGSEAEPVPGDADVGALLEARERTASERLFPEPTTGEEPTDGSPGTSADSWYPLVSEGSRCAGCGLVIGELPARALGAQVRDEVHAFGDLLLEVDDDAVRIHHAPATWSALEYGVHVRDLLTVFAERVIRTLAEHQPTLSRWDHEADIADGMANESDVSAVVDDMGRNAAKLSEALRLVTEDDWDRSASRWGGERITIEELARFALHEVVHHRDDARRALVATQG